MRRIINVLIILIFVVGCATTKSDVVNESKVAESHYKMGLAYLEGSNDSMAMAEFEKALKLESNNGKVHYAISTFYLKRNDIIKAEESIKKAMELDPDEPEYINAYGSIIAASGDVDGALEAWKQVLSFPSYPTVERIYYNMGYLLYDHSRYNESKEYFFEATKISKSFMLPYLYLYKINQIQHNPDASEKILKQALDAHPLFLPIMFELGKFYFENRRYADSAKMFSQVLELYPKSDYVAKSKIYLNRMGIHNE